MLCNLNWQSVCAGECREHGGKVECFQKGTIPGLSKASQTVPGGLSEGELLEWIKLITEGGRAQPHPSPSGSFHPSSDQGRFCQEC